MLSLIVLELYLVTLLVALFLLIKLLSSEKRRFRTSKELGIDDNLPTVSVCIPVRNETQVMSECLELVLASDYPKLEIIVLDDNSIDGTPNIVRAFAHAGVRFVPGDELPEGWVGKNYSMKKLLEESSGRYILFMDADTRISTRTISLLVDRLLEERIDMLSVVPQRADFNHASTWFGHLRFLWDLVLHTEKKPSASSAVWMADRKRLLQDFNGFDLWRDSVQPEIHLAEGFARADDYRLIISTPDLGVTFQKKWSSQIDSSKRILMQRLGDSAIGVSLAIGLMLFVLLPQAGFILFFVTGRYIEAVLSAFMAIMVMIVLLTFYRMYWTKRWLLSVFVMPIVLWQELTLLFISMASYLRGTIVWKGRQITRPSRQAIKD